ncbi:cohesin domain-containing protein [Ammoniphilus sp. CFH 90114]|uniref:cohesin domain-containing protein n=1 Tax=Ammoniphilus sp. CFH 90114 TaxID=2493665 RepID=UPI00100DD48F|nr:cohesin domain-containing protein [Ammoniphilus sp. CFH 90114]RXT02858.1 hypothetical protein EIZ39_24005 [Ammoniphilus sp. CFH 90114]
MNRKNFRVIIQLLSSFMLLFTPFGSSLHLEAATLKDLTVAKVVGQRGAEVVVPIHLTSAGEVRGLQFDLEFDTSVVNLQDVVRGNDLALNFDFQYNPSLRTSGNKKTIRVFIASMSKDITPNDNAEVAKLVFNMEDQGPVKTSLKLSGVVISNAIPKNITTQFVLNDGEIALDDKTPPTLGLTLNPNGPTNGNVTIQVDANGTGSQIVKLKWDSGVQNIEYFATNGNPIPLDNPTFPVSEPGWYTVYAEDELGNKTVRSFEIKNIDKDAPSVIGIVDEETYGPIGGGVTWEDENPTTAKLKRNGHSEVDYLPGTPILETGCYTLVITDGAGNTTTVNFCVDASAPNVNLIPNPSTPTEGNVIVTVEAIDEGEVTTGVKRIKWAKGSNGKEYFEGNGEEITESKQFVADVAGPYTVYVEDHAGNVTVKEIMISNIDRNKPVIKDIEDGKTYGPIEDGVVWEDDTPTRAKLKRDGYPEEEYLPGTPILETGCYTLVITDSAANSSTIQFCVDATAPTVLLNPTPSTPTNGDVIVQVESTDEGTVSSGVKLIKWAKGKHPKEHFDDNGEDITVDKQFVADDNGTYTVYVVDNVGNITVKEIEIDNIYKNNNLTLDLKKSPVDLTQKGIVITADVEMVKPLTVNKKWAKGEQDLAFFQTNGTAMSGSSLLVTREMGNGYYTIYVKDAAGNEAVKSIFVLVVGDVNQDHTVNIFDLDFIGRFIVDLDGPTPLQQFMADANGDDAINVLDWILITGEVLRFSEQN